MKNRRFIIAGAIASAILLAFGVFLFLFKQVGGSDTASAVDISKVLTDRYGSNPKMLGAAKQFAGTLERAIQNPSEALAINDEFQASLSCLRAVEIEIAGKRVLTDTSTQIVSILVNTPARVRAYIKFSSGLSGQLIPILKADVSNCYFHQTASEE